MQNGFVPRRRKRRNRRAEKGEGRIVVRDGEKDGEKEKRKRDAKEGIGRERERRKGGEGKVKEGYKISISLDSLNKEEKTHNHNKLPLIPPFLLAMYEKFTQMMMLCKLDQLREKEMFGLMDLLCLISGRKRRVARNVLSILYPHGAGSNHYTKALLIRAGVVAGQHISPVKYRTILKYRLMIPLFPVDEICQVCRKACLDSFGERAVHCKELSGFTYRHDMVRDVIFYVCREKHACIDQTRVSPLVGLSSRGFTVRQTALKAASCKVTNTPQKANALTIYVFIPFAVRYLCFLCTEDSRKSSSTELNESMHSHVMTLDPTKY
ncbi:hypothetical protein Tco_0209008 [Tanacetum coccineum]